MNTVEIVLPATYTNAWLLTVINAFDELDVEVRFVNVPSKPWPYYYPYYQQWTTGGVIKTGDVITINGSSKTGNAGSWASYEAKNQAEIEAQIAAYKLAYPEKMAGNQEAFNKHRESAAQLDAEDKYRPWYKGENYDPNRDK